MATRFVLPCGFLLGPCIAQANRPDEDWLFRRAIAIEAEISLALKLNRLVGFGVGECRLKPSLPQNFQRVRVQIGRKILSAARIGFCEQRIVKRTSAGTACVADTQ